ncbi:Rid family hydrolase [Streptomyces carpinensis]|uniref:Rid family hydrolase n=1 Tax=Streptomyces carpinensis TaxID=66369 RepID=A0ABV1VV69_9ACTN|nr:Rid family hydrolase [Streptomyces carpinensis]
MFTRLSPSWMDESARSFGYSPGIRVGDLIFVSGLIGRGPDGNVPESVEEQTALILDSLEQVLAEGGAALRNVVQVITYHTDLSEVRLFADGRGEPFDAETPPTWTAIGVNGLAHPGARVELQALAVVTH